MSRQTEANLLKQLARQSALNRELVKRLIKFQARYITLVKLLIQKGVFTQNEYSNAFDDQMGEQDADQQAQQLLQRFGDF